MAFSRTLATRAGGTLTFTTLGFGAGTIGRLADDAAAASTVAAAWRLDLRFFDTAPLYGRGLSERRLGEALRRHDRDAFILSTKVGLPLDPGRPDDAAVYDYSHDGIMRSFHASIARLGLSRIDILLVHDLDVATHGSQAAADTHLRALVDGGGWRALDRLRQDGTVAAIGAGLNGWEASERLLNLLDPDIFLLAGRYTLLEQGAVDSFLPACAARGVGVVVGGPFNSGVLATGPIEGARYNYAPAPPWVMERASALQEVCRAHGVSLARAALQFPFGHPAVVAVLAGGATPDEVARNVASLGSPVPDALWSDIKAAGLLHPYAPTPLGEHHGRP